MRSTVLPFLTVVVLLAPTRDVRAATLQAGPGKTYATPCAAIAAASVNDVIEVDPVTYAGETCAINTNGLTVRAVGGMATLDVQGVQPAQRKGILVASGDNLTLENLIFLHAEISDADGANAAGIRMQGQHLTVRHCIFRDNQNGILATPLQAGGELLVEYSEFDHNGIGNGCANAGCTHNMYVHHLDRFTLQYSWSHNVETGHLVKSRATQSFILYNRIGSEGNTTSSRQIDLPNGGDAYVVGNVIQKDASAGNPSLITYGEEGLTNAAAVLHVVNNTFVNARSPGTFVELASGAAPAVVRNNIFAGPGTPWTQGTVSADNVVVTGGIFVDADFHLAAGASAINHGVDPGAATISLSPVYEYVHPLQRTARVSDGTLDCGAFERGTVVSTSSSSGVTGSSSAVSHPSSTAVSHANGSSSTVLVSSGASAVASASESSGGGDTGATRSGCQCLAPVGGHAWLAWVVLLLWVSRRRV